MQIVMRIVFLAGILIPTSATMACEFNPSCGEACSDSDDVDAMSTNGDAGNTDGGLPIDAMPEPPSILEFVVSDDKVREGETVTLTWATNVSVTACSASADNGATDFSGSQAVNGLVEVVPHFRMTTYTLTCFDQAGVESEPKSVVVAAMRMSVTGATVVSDGNYRINRGQQVLLSWNGDDTVSVSCGGMSQPAIQGGLTGGSYEVAGSRPQFQPLYSATHTFVCFSMMSNITYWASIYIEVIQPPP